MAISCQMTANAGCGAGLAVGAVFIVVSPRGAIDGFPLHGFF